MLPWSTWRSPTSPPMGAVMLVHDSCSFALSSWAWSSFTVPSSCFTMATCWSTCCDAMESCASSFW